VKLTQKGECALRRVYARAESLLEPLHNHSTLSDCFVSLFVVGHGSVRATLFSFFFLFEVLSNLPVSVDEPAAGDRISVQVHHLQARALPASQNIQTKDPRQGMFWKKKKSRRKIHTKPWTVSSVPCRKL